VGTGATLIYPLLGWSLFRWSFVAIDTCQQSYESSKALVEANQLKEVIDLRLSRPIDDL
jgi:23S rRNA (adenine1618-N6)-methyltransferase